jgi:hypothetical protein
MEHEPRIIARWLRRLNFAQFKPDGLSVLQWRHIRDSGLAEFHEWPSGHFRVTDRGLTYIQEHGGED